jgi:predicted nucleic acid-binding protein
MILVDTSILVAYLRSPTKYVSQMMQQYDAAVCGVIRAELLHGARNVPEIGRLIQALDQFRQIPTPETLWDELGRNLCLLRMRGIQVPLSDALIATTAIQNGVELWADDHHYLQIQTVLPQLRLFQLPSK